MERRCDSNRSHLFIALIKPHRPVVSSTIARWIKYVLTKSGIDTGIFKAHSVRSAAVSTAANAGVTTKGSRLEQWVCFSEVLLQTWEQKLLWCYSTIKAANHRTAMIATKSRWYGDRAFWSIITGWLRPLEVVTSYSGLYEECEVEHINVPSRLYPTLDFLPKPEMVDMAT